MKGIASRVSRIHRMVALTALLLVSLVAIFAVQVRSAPTAHAYITCSSTHWVTMATNTGFFSNWSIHGGIQARRDSVNNSFCNEVRAFNDWTEGTGSCHIFYAAVVNSSGNPVHTHGTNYVCGPASAITYTSGYAVGDGQNWQGCGYIDGWPIDAICRNWFTD